jgi:hypothetical protein
MMELLDLDEKMLVARGWKVVCATSIMDVL